MRKPVATGKIRAAARKLHVERASHRRRYAQPTARAERFETVHEQIHDFGDREGQHRKGQIPDAAARRQPCDACAGGSAACDCKDESDPRADAQVVEERSRQYTRQCRRTARGRTKTCRRTLQRYSRPRLLQRRSSRETRRRSSTTRGKIRPASRRRRRGGSTRHDILRSCQTRPIIEATPAGRKIRTATSNAYGSSAPYEPGRNKRPSDCAMPTSMPARIVPPATPCRR